jgi:putative two-component system response regulator
MSERMNNARSPSPRILILDDEAPVRALFRRWLVEQGYEVQTAGTPGQALEVLGQVTVDVMLSDICMPGRSGLEMLPAFQRRSPATAIVMITAHGEAQTAIQALTHGASGYLIKPVDRNAVIREVEMALARRNRIVLDRDLKRELRSQLRGANHEIVQRLISASRLRDQETGTHILRTGLLSEALATQAGWDEENAEDIRWAAPLHDLGKIGIPDSILLKPGPLNDEERAAMRSHTAIGGQILAGSARPVLQLAREIAVYHHEWWNGNGYPHGLQGQHIPFAARIVAVVDVFDALTHDRVYRPAMSRAEALELMSEERGTHFDPELFDLFLAQVDTLDEILDAHPDEDLNAEWQRTDEEPVLVGSI